MKRIAKPGEFRSNVHLGGKVENYDISPERKKVQLKQ